MLLPQSKEDQFINLIFGIDGIFYFVALGIDCFADCISFKAADHIQRKGLIVGKKHNSFVPEILNTKIYDSVVPVDNDDAFGYARLISHTEGILVGISAGAALYAAIEWAKKPENEGKTIVALLPDSGDRYYSTSLFEN